MYRGEVKAQKDLMKVALYIALFPQLIAGPIVKYHDIEQSICNKRVITSDLFVEGIKRFLCGLGKKVLIANNMGLVADKIFNMAPAPYQSYAVIQGWQARNQLEMKEQVEIEIKKEIKYLRKKAMGLLGPSNLSPFEMANVVKKIRELRGLLHSLVKASFERLKTLWLRFVHGIM